jgi:uncharacterized protein (DUF2062 family)
MMIALRISAVLTMIGLALMCWSILQPTPLPVMLAMTVGQGIGVLAFGIYGYIVVRELRRELAQRRSDARAASAASAEEPTP